MDGGYYSQELIGILIDRKINFVFRLPSNNLFINDHGSDKFDIISTNNNTAKCKIVNFTKNINNQIVYLLTNLINHNTKTLTDHFWYRWEVETDFRKLKYDIMYERIRSKSEKQVMIDIKILNFIGIVSGCLEKYCKPKAGHKINFKNLLELLFTHLLHIILYKKITKDIFAKILSIMEIITTTVEIIRKKRRYQRRRVFPSTKWNINGNRFGTG